MCTWERFSSIHRRDILISSLQKSFNARMSVRLKLLHPSIYLSIHSHLFSSLHRHRGLLLLQFSLFVQEDFFIQFLLIHESYPSFSLSLFVLCLIERISLSSIGQKKELNKLLECPQAFVCMLPRFFCLLAFDHSQTACIHTYIHTIEKRT